MAFPERKIRGLQNIRTLSGKENQALPAHKAYMRIACLEMERSRRGEEKNSALARVKNIDARFNDIDAEKEAILASLAQQGTAQRCNGAPALRRSDLPASPPEEDPSLETQGLGFSFRY
jgi:hypothetical protein